MQGSQEIVVEWNPISPSRFPTLNTVSSLQYIPAFPLFTYVVIISLYMCVSFLIILWAFYLNKLLGISLYRCIKLCFLFFFLETVVFPFAEWTIMYVFYFLLGDMILNLPVIRKLIWHLFRAWFLWRHIYGEKTHLISWRSLKITVPVSWIWLVHSLTWPPLDRGANGGTERLTSEVSRARKRQSPVLKAPSSLVLELQCLRLVEQLLRSAQGIVWPLPQRTGLGSWAPSYQLTSIHWAFTLCQALH